MEHKDEVRRIFKIPVGNRKWYQFWKKKPVVEIKELLKSYQEEVKFDDKEIWIPVDDNKS